MRLPAVPETWLSQRSRISPMLCSERAMATALMIPLMILPARKLIPALMRMRLLKTLQTMMLRQSLTFRRMA